MMKGGGPRDPKDALGTQGFRIVCNWAAPQLPITCIPT